MASVVWLPIILCLGTGWLYFLTKYGPEVHVHKHDGFQFPSTLDELKNLSNILQQYHKSNPAYVITLFTSAYIYKQMFAIPGSIFLNLLGGALFGMPIGFLLVCLLSACGASSCYLLSNYFGRDQVLRWFPDKISLVQKRIDDNRDRLFYFLLFIRLFPMTPNWFINIASPIVNIPLHHFFLSVFFGLMPYNFVCVQTGIILRDLHSMDDIFTFPMVIKLIMVAMAALTPMLLKKRSSCCRTTKLAIDTSDIDH